MWKFQGYQWNYQLCRATHTQLLFFYQWGKKGVHTVFVMLTKVFVKSPRAVRILSLYLKLLVLQIWYTGNSINSSITSWQIASVYRCFMHCAQSEKWHFCFTTSCYQSNWFCTEAFALVTVLGTAWMQSSCWSFSSCIFFPEFTWPDGYFPDSSQCCQSPQLQLAGSWFLGQRWRTHRSGIETRSPV